VTQRMPGAPPDAPKMRAEITVDAVTVAVEPAERRKEKQAAKMKAQQQRKAAEEGDATKSEAD